MELEEKFIDIEGFEGLYQVNSFGYIRALDRIIVDKNGKPQTKKGCILKGWIDAGGYLMVGLNKGNKRTAVKVHRMVAKYFVMEFDKTRVEVNHIDRNKLNNHFLNLEWVTPKENMKHLEDNFDFDYGRKIVQMLSENDEVLLEFKSISDAARYCNAPIDNNGKPRTQNITRAIKTKKYAYGYKWKFKIN